MTPLDELGMAITNAGYTWTPEMRKAYEKGVRIQNRGWVGLDEDEVAQAMYRADAIITGPMQQRFAKEIEAALKAKNT
jgi:hypothetical protein